MIYSLLQGKYLKHNLSLFSSIEFILWEILRQPPGFSSETRQLLFHLFQIYKPLWSFLSVLLSIISLFVRRELNRFCIGRFPCSQLICVHRVVQDWFFTVKVRNLSGYFIPLPNQPIDIPHGAFIYAVGVRTIVRLLSHLQ